MEHRSPKGSPHWSPPVLRGTLHMRCGGCPQAKFRIQARKHAPRLAAIILLSCPCQQSMEVVHDARARVENHSSGRACGACLVFFASYWSCHVSRRCLSSFFASLIALLCCIAHLGREPTPLAAWTAGIYDARAPTASYHAITALVARLLPWGIQSTQGLSWHAPYLALLPRPSVY